MTSDIPTVPASSWCTTAATSTTSTASSTEPVVIVKNYVNGSTWRREYSDGWIEQGGVIYGESNGGSKVVSIVKMANTDYYATILPVDTATSWSSTNITYQDITIGSVTVSSFKVYFALAAVPKRWMVCGYKG